MNQYHGTKTEENLNAALAGESIARNKYTYFAAAARKEGLNEIADAFEKLAKNEMMHAKLWFEALHGAPGSAAENLVEAAKGEYGEWHSMYPGFAKQAEEEGFSGLADMFKHVADIERDHEHQFMSLLAALVSGTKTAEPARPQPKTQEKNGYRCVFCGAVFETRSDVCKVCQAIGSFEQCKYKVEID